MAKINALIHTGCCHRLTVVQLTHGNLNFTGEVSRHSAQVNYSLILGLSFACSSPAGGMLFGVSGLLFLLLLLGLQAARDPRSVTAKFVVSYSTSQAEAGAGPGVVEGGCQPVLACRCF